MTANDRMVLRNDAANIEGETAFQLGMIVAIDEMLESLEKYAGEEMSAKALNCILSVVWYSKLDNIRASVLDKYGMA